MINWILERTRLVRNLRESVAHLEGLHYEMGQASQEKDRRLAELEERLRPRPARLRLAGGMTEAQIEEALRGTAAMAPVRAFGAHLQRKIVQASDAATGEPRETVVTPDRVIMGYGEDLRLHDAGRVTGYAEILADLQQLTAVAEGAEN